MALTTLSSLKKFFFSTEPKNYFKNIYITNKPISIQFNINIVFNKTSIVRINSFFNFFPSQLI